MNTMGKLQTRKSPAPHDCVNFGEDDEMIVEGYIVSRIKLFVTGLLIVLSAGSILILFAWRPGVWIRFTHKRCSLDQAQKLILRNLYDEEFVEKVNRPQLRHNVKSVTGDCVHFYHKKIKYIWREELSQFAKLKGYESEKCGLLYSMTEGLSTDESAIKSQLYGINSVLVEIKPIWKLIVDEITGPFYIYQMFIFTVWMIQLYYQFALCVLFLSILSVSMHVWQTRKQTVALREKVHSESEVVVIRDQKKVSMMSPSLVPGDVLVLPAHGDSFTMECDAVLISGTCTVDESMLSGESVPITKVALSEDPSKFYSTTVHKNHTLFCGTQVLHVQTTDCAHVKAIVIRTGFSTAKGELVRAILFPKMVNFKLRMEFIKFIGIFFMIGIPLMVYTAYCFGRLKARVHDIIIIVLDVATFLVPPLLPAIMTSVNAHAQRRLKKKGVYCLDPNVINSCGGLDLVCFDKTGTLTEDSIDLSGVIGCSEGSFQPASRTVLSLPVDNKLVISMGSCHSLAVHNGKVDGENLDLKLFEAVNWEFKDDKCYDPKKDQSMFERCPERIVGPIEFEDDEDTQLFGIVKQFPFESRLQRMLVIVKRSSEPEYTVYLKGAPEVIELFCRRDTIPEDFYQVLESYTRDGMRVIASASKQLHLMSYDECLHLSREALESDLQFDGFMVFQNCLKPETASTLKTLNKADIRSVMVTGDNMLTAISVARNCGMIQEKDSVIQVEAELFEGITRDKPRLRVSYNYVKLPGFSEKISIKQNGGLEEVLLPFIRHTGDYHLAVDGKSFSYIRTHDPKLLDRVVHKGTIFARMQPDQKLQLIETYQRQGHQVGMCGDGANDCGALRIANAGVSLSVAESSVASPFTYKEKNISCVPLLIREGRATLSATFGAFKYQVSYCFVLLGAVLILFWDGSKPSDGAYVFVDIILNILPPMVFGTTKAYPYLVKQMPTRSILSFLPQFSMYSFILIQILLYFFIKHLTIMQTWYEPFKFNLAKTHHSEPSHLALAIFSVNTMSYVIAAIIFSPGPPYRKDIFSNKAYCFVVLLNFAMVSCVALYPPNFVLRYINFKDVPMEFKMLLFTISLVNFIVMYVWEVILLQGFVFHWVMPRVRRWRGPIHRHEKIEAELAQSDSWPPVIGSQPTVEPPPVGTLTRKPTDVLIMRSTSDDSQQYQYPSFGISIGEEETDNRNNESVKFTTFMTGKRPDVVGDGNEFNNNRDNSFV